MTQKIGIIGLGYVGTAVYEAFKGSTDCKIYDIKKPNVSVSQLTDLVEENRFLFICLPTPMNKTGECNISIINDTLQKLNEFKTNFKIPIIIKSTLPPQSTKKFNKNYLNLNLVFNPEFLTEANFIDDFKNQDRIIIGTTDTSLFKDVENLYRGIFPNTKTIMCDSTTAEMVKYVSNTFLATKVSYANEINGICNFLNISYDEVIEIAVLDNRLGDSHWRVPGPDGRLGFGGSCFPKDINALIYFCKENNISINTINSAWDTNLEIRPEKDWEELRGRAIADNEE